MELITDRTETDAVQGTKKGVYSYADLNRVEMAVEEIAQQIATLGFALQFQTKTDWQLPENFTVESWPVESQMRRYLKNIADIKRVFLIPTQIPDSMDKLDWRGANNIEKVLLTAFDRITGIKQSFRYSGEIYAGEDTL